MSFTIQDLILCALLQHRNTKSRKLLEIIHEQLIMFPRLP